MSVIFVDTDIVIDFLRGKPGARKFLVELSEQSNLACSVITIAELYAGMRDSEEEATRELIAGLAVFPLTLEIAEKAGRLKYLTKGHTLDLDDCLIAATAMSEGGSLATKNTRRYPFAELKLVVPDNS